MFIVFVLLWITHCAAASCTSSDGEIWAPGGSRFVAYCSVEGNCPDKSECNSAGEVGTTVTCQIATLQDVVWTCVQNSNSAPRWSRPSLDCAAPQTCSAGLGSIVSIATSRADLDLLAGCGARGMCPPSACCANRDDVGSVTQCGASVDTAMLWGCVTGAEVPYFRQICNAYCGSSIGSISTGAACSDANNCPAAGCCDMASQAGSTIACINGAGATVSYNCSNPGNTPIYTPVPLVPVCPVGTGAVGIPYSSAITATGGSGVYSTFAISGGPSWGSVNSNTGLLTGSPTLGTHTFSITVTDSAGATASKECSILVQPPPTLVCAGTLPVGEVGVSYPSTSFLTASGGTGSGYTYSLVSISPSLSGMSISSGTGRLSSSGGPSTSGSFSVTVRVTDSGLGTDEATCPLTILPAPKPVCPSTTSVFAGQLFSEGISFTGGTTTGTATFSVQNVSANRTGFIFRPGFGSGSNVLSGTQDDFSGAPILYTYTIRVVDSVGGSGTRTCSLLVYPPPQVTCPSLEAITTGESFSGQAGVSGGNFQYTFVGQGAGFPSPLSVNGAGLVTSGTINTAQTITYQIQVTSGPRSDTSVTCTLQVLIPPSITCPNYPDGQVGAAYAGVSFTNPASSTGITSWQRVSGSFPGSVNINSGTGVVSSSKISGNPGTFTFRIRITDLTGKQATTGDCSILVTAGPVAVCPTNLLATVGVQYNAAITGTGGSGTYTDLRITNSRPSWLSQTVGTGALSASNPQVGTYSFRIRVTDSLGAQSSKQTCVLTVTNPPTFSCPLGFGTQNVEYSETLSANGGASPLVWTLESSPTPPAWLSITSGGVLSGTPPAQDTYNFAIKVTDANNQMATQTCSIVTSGPPTASCPTYPIGYVGSPYTGPSITVNSGAGCTSNCWVYTSGSGTGIAGLTSSSTLNRVSGVISGTIGNSATAGTYTFNLRYTDNAGAVVNLQDCSIEVRKIDVSCPVDGSFTVSNAQVGQPFSKTITPTGGVGPYSFALSVPSGLAWLTINGAGVMSGIPASPVCGSSNPSAPCTFSYTVTVSDSGGGQFVLNCQIAVYGTPGYTCPTSRTISTSASAQNVAIDPPTGGAPPYTFAVTFNPAVPGAVVTTNANGLQGNVNAVFNTPGSYQMCITVTDAFGQTSSEQCCPLTVVGVLSFECPPPTGFTCGYTHTMAGIGGTGNFSWSSNVFSFDVPTSGVLTHNVTSAVPVTGTINLQDLTSLESFSRSCTVDFSGPSINCPRINRFYRGIPYSQPMRDCDTCTFYQEPWSSTRYEGSVLANGTLSFTSTQTSSRRVRVGARQATGACTVRNCYIYSRPAPILRCPTDGSPSANKVTQGSSWSATLITSSDYARGTRVYTFTGFPVTPAVSSLTSSRPRISLTSSQISGFTPGNFTYTVRLTDDLDADLTVTCWLLVSPPIGVSCPATTTGTRTVNFSGNVLGAGTPPLTYRVEGSLPNGVSLDESTGALSGVVTASGTFIARYRVTDATGQTALSADCPIVIVDPPVPVCHARYALVGQAFSSSVTVTGCQGACTFATSTSLPAGFSLSSAGVLSAASTPNAPGVTTIAIVLTDAGSGATVNVNCPLEIAGPPSAVTCPAAGNVNVGQLYSSSATRTGGAVGTPTFSIATGALPPGVTIKNAGTGLIEGFPTSPAPYPQDYTFKIRLTDAAGQVLDSADCMIRVHAPLTITCPTIGPLKFATAGSGTATSTGGFGAKVFSKTSTGNSFITVSSAGLVNVNPTTQEGRKTYKITVTDATTGSVETSPRCEVTINAAINIDCPATVNMTVGQAYSELARGSGGRGSTFYQYSFNPAAPLFSIVEASGLITTVTPFSSATSGSYTVELTDGIDTVSKMCTYNVFAPIVPGCPSFNKGTVSVAVPSNPSADVVIVSGGSGQGLAFSVVNGSLPNGLLLNAGTGRISGIPTTAGNFTFSVNILDDAGGNATTSNCMIEIVGKPQPVCPPSSAPITFSYTGNLGVIGGIPSYSYGISGVLPSGLTLVGSTIVGSPNFAGSTTFTLTVTDGNGLTGSTQCVILVTSPGCTSVNFAGPTLANSSSLCTDCSTCKRIGNPCFSKECQLNVVLILDESGSIDPFKSEVRQGVLSFVTGMQNIVNVGGTVNLGVISFGTLAKIEYPLTPFTSDFSNTLVNYTNNEYLNDLSFTNWADALNLARTTNWGDVVDVFVMFSDGNPQSATGPWTCDANCYDYESGPGQVFFSDLCQNGECTANMPPDTSPQPSGLTFQTTASNEREGLWASCTAADLLKSTGSKLFFVGVGDVALNEDEIQVITGPIEWDLQPTTFFTSDYVINKDYAKLGELFAAVGTGLCPCLASYPDCSASTTYPTSCSGQLFSARVRVTTTDNSISTVFPPASTVSAYIYYQLGGTSGRVAYDFFNLNEDATVSTPNLLGRTDYLNPCKLQRAVQCGGGCFSVQEKQNLPRFFLEQPDTLGTAGSIRFNSATIAGCTGYTKVYPQPTFPPNIGTSSPETIKYIWVLTSDNVTPCAAEAYDGTFYEFYSNTADRGVSELGQAPKKQPGLTVGFDFNPTSTCVVAECARPVELVFVIDEQVSLTSDFPFVRTFVADLVKNTQLTDSIFGWRWTNSSVPNDVLTLTGATPSGATTNLDISFFSVHPQGRGTTDFADAITKAVNLYWPTETSLSGFPRQLVTIVGGPDAGTDHSRWQTVRDLLKARNVEYWAVGVNVGASNATLLGEIASTNQYIHYSTYSQGSFLAQGRADLSQRLCPAGNLCGEGCKGFCKCASQDTCECPTCVQDNCTDTRTCPNIESGCVGAPKNCDDSDACTTDTCDLITGCKSVLTVICDDGSPCTTDQCLNKTGLCSYVAKSCPPSGQCVISTCNALGNCEETPINVTVACDDNNVCTMDTCNDNTGCVNTNITATLCDDMNACTFDSCDPINGCSYTPINCNSTNMCVVTSCNTTTGCVETPVNCDDGDACTADTCNPATGCVNTPLADGYCDSLLSAKCLVGTCDTELGCLYEETICDDSNPCTIDTCNNATGCIYTNVTTCNDNDECTDDSCDVNTGLCRYLYDASRCSACGIGSCPVANQCEVPLCIDQSTNVTCSDPRVPSKAICDVSILSAPYKYCFTVPKVCDDNNLCTNNTCNPATGCVYTDISASCLTGDQCLVEACVPDQGCVSSAVVCNDNKACTIDTCNPVSGCNFTAITCDDGNKCTDDVCSEQQGGVCVYTPKVCDTSNMCNIYDCDCTFVPRNCSDNNVCTTDTCNAATGCSNVDTSNCDDGLKCTRDSCDPIMGCVYEPVICNPSTNCSNFVCSEANGLCEEVPLTCDDNNPCTADTCDPASGCVNTERECFTTSKCAIHVCNNNTGICEFSANRTCDDGSSCTDDSCLADIGCVYRNITCPPGANACLFGFFCDGTGVNPQCIYLNITSLLDLCGVCLGSNSDCFFSSVLGAGQISAITGGVLAGIIVAAVIAALIALYLSKKGYDYYSARSDLTAAGAQDNPYFVSNELEGSTRFSEIK